MLTGETLNVLAQYGDPSINDNQFTQPIPIDAEHPRRMRAAVRPEPGHAVRDQRRRRRCPCSPRARSPTPPPECHRRVDERPGAPASHEVQELDCWRVQLTSRTPTACRCPATDLAVTADRPVGVWQASGNTELSHGPPGHADDGPGRPGHLRVPRSRAGFGGAVGTAGAERHADRESGHGTARMVTCTRSWPAAPR